MQVEDKFKFSKIDTISISDNSNAVTLVSTKSLAIGKVADDKDLKGLTDNNEIIIENTSPVKLLPHLAVVNDKKIYGLNVCSSANVGFYSQGNAITPVPK